MKSRGNSKTMGRTTGVPFPVRPWFFSLDATSRPTLGLPQPPIQWVPGTLYPGVNRPVLEADRSPPSNSEVKNAYSNTSTSPYVFIEWCSITGGVYFYCYSITCITQNEIILSLILSSQMEYSTV